MVSFDVTVGVIKFIGSHLTKETAGKDSQCNIRGDDNLTENKQTNVRLEI
jgi:hypothetical protein